jgi:hypothetical protein
MKCSASSAELHEITRPAEDDRITPQGVRLIRDVRTLLLRDCGRHPPVVVGCFRASFHRLRSVPFLCPFGPYRRNLIDGETEPPRTSPLRVVSRGERASRPSKGRGARPLRARGPSGGPKTKAAAEVGKRARAQK